MPNTIEASVPVVSAKRAIQISMDSFREFFPEALDSNPMLEEIELSEDGKAWLITVGFDSKTPRKSNPLAFEFGGVDRVYKRFSVDALHGNVISIKIRTV